MNDKNNRNNQENMSEITQKEDNRQQSQSGIYLRDDHCDWGSSGMNEFTNEYKKDKSDIYLLQELKTVQELDNFSKDAFLQSALRDQKVGQIAIAYTVWSKKKGGGKLIVKEVFKMIKKSNHLNRLVTLSPLTEMATNFHLRNKARLISVNEETQNFEYTK